MAFFCLFFCGGASVRVGISHLIRVMSLDTVYAYGGQTATEVVLRVSARNKVLEDVERSRLDAIWR